MAKHVCWSCEGTEKEEEDQKCFWCDGSGFEIEDTDMPICPFCGEELSTDDLYESGWRYCYECNNDVYVEIEYTPTYTTNPNQKRKGFNG